MRRQQFVVAVSTFATIACLSILLTATARAGISQSLALVFFAFQDEPAEAEEAAAPSPAPIPADSPIAFTPKTPAEFLEAIQLALDVARVDLAAVYLPQLQNLAKDDATLLALRDRYGVAPFVRMTHFPELRIAAEALLAASDQAVRNRSQSPEYIAGLLRQLRGIDDEKASAMEELRALGVDGVPILVRLLADNTVAELHPAIVETLGLLGPSAVPQLIAAVDAPQSTVRAGAATALGSIRDLGSTTYLWGPAVADASPDVRTAATAAIGRILNINEAQVTVQSGDNVVARLLAGAREHFNGTYTWETDPATGKVSIWIWNSSLEGLERINVAPEAASDFFGARLAKHAQAISPTNPAVQSMYVSLALAADARRIGSGGEVPTGPGTAHDLAASLGPDLVGRVLAEALSNRRAISAIAALQVLELIGTEGQYRGESISRGPIASALNYPDIRVQFAAANTILKLDPTKPLPQSGRVVQTLVRAAASDSQQYAVICDPSTDRASKLGGMLSRLGYNPVMADSGREAFRLAAERGDISLICLHPGISGWVLSQTHSNLRADSRTALLPIVIVGSFNLDPIVRRYETPRYSIVSTASASMRKGVEHMLVDDRYMAFAEEPIELTDLEAAIKPLLIKTAASIPSQADRTAMRLTAMQWLAKLATTRRTNIFDLNPALDVLDTAVHDPSLAMLAMEPLGELPSARCQNLLAELTMGPQTDIEIRTAAAGKLAAHIQRYSLLVGKKTIEELLVLWQDPQTPPALSTAIGGVIGVLRPNVEKVGERVRRHSEPAAPGR